VVPTGELNNADNYQPISLLPVFSKIIEKIVAKRLFFLEVNDTLSSSQTQLV
jgi:hypothetical protein